MKKVVNVHEAKTQLSRLLARVERGEEIVIARGGEPVARLLPYRPRAGRLLGNDRDTVCRLRLPSPPADYIASRLRETRTTCLPVSCAHAGRVADLPHHHRDPFDRLLVAQAQVERVRLLTADAIFARYDMETMPA